jgi:hypothetical protein
MDLGERTADMPTLSPMTAGMTVNFTSLPTSKRRLPDWLGGETVRIPGGPLGSVALGDVRYVKVLGPEGDSAYVPEVALGNPPCALCGCELDHRVEEH